MTFSLIDGRPTGFGAVLHRDKLTLELNRTEAIKLVKRLLDVVEHGTSSDDTERITVFGTLRDES